MPRALHALAAYVAITIGATWPLAAGLGRDVPGDLGDPLLNMWILAWDVEQIRAILGGDLSRIPRFFDANIFHPAPLTLAYSEHLLAQALQIFPVYLLTDNPILVYNLLFLSTFVLSGFGMYLLTRELTGSATAAFVAGLIFAFAPFRLAHAGHLQVLSSHWMPFVLYGLTRYVRTGRLRALGGASLALTAQNLSCGYYLLYFAPFVAGYALWELWRHGVWRDRWRWASLAGAAALVALVTLPALLPYAELRQLTGSLRSTAEVTRFSADVYSYATAPRQQRVWGERLQAFPKPEGELFPGLVPLLLALIGLAPRRAAADVGEQRTGNPWLVWPLTAAVIAFSAAAAATILERRIAIDLGIFVLRMSDVDRLLIQAAAAFVLLAAISPRTRAHIRHLTRERGFFVAGLVAVLWLSLGPEPQALGRPLDIAAPYRLLFEHIPGFDGLRVPARFAMIGALLLATLAGYGAARLLRLRWGGAALGVLGIFLLLESTQVPFPMNGATPLNGYSAPERIVRPARAPAVYREVARLGAEATLAELPLGVPTLDVRAVYYSTVHWRPLLNGYSGFFPPHYNRLALALADVPRDPELSLMALTAAGATHAIVHEGAYFGDAGTATTTALRRLGAVELYRDGSDVLLELPR